MVYDSLGNAKENKLGHKHICARRKKIPRNSKGTGQNEGKRTQESQKLWQKVSRNLEVPSVPPDRLFLLSLVALPPHSKTHSKQTNKQKRTQNPPRVLNTPPGVFKRSQPQSLIILCLHTAYYLIWRKWDLNLFLFLFPARSSLHNLGWS